MNAEEFNRDFKEFLKTPEAVEIIGKTQKLVQKTYEDSLTNPIAPDWDNSLVNEGMKCGSVQFFILVWLPCWLEYGESASRLLELAESGDLAALERLLQIGRAHV